jgi:hypothetical protein
MLVYSALLLLEHEPTTLFFSTIATLDHVDTPLMASISMPRTAP